MHHEDAHRRCVRSDVLRRIAVGEDRRGMRELQAAFDGEDDLLQAAQQFWLRHLTVAVEMALESGAGTVESDVAGAYAATVRRFPGLRVLLDEHAEHVAVAAGRKRQDALLSLSAGRPADAVVSAAAGLGGPQRARMRWTLRVRRPAPLPVIP